jgi:hypothetical protein
MAGPHYILNNVLCKKNVCAYWETERHNLKKVNCVKFREQYQFEVLNSFASLEYLNGMWATAWFRKVLDKISTFLPNRIEVMN